MEKGYIHIYTGDGKGKTTAAVGLCYRCANRGFKVGITSFLKDFDSGEYLGNPPFHIFKALPFKGFWRDKNESEKANLKAEAKERLAFIFQTAKEDSYDCIALDEIFDAISVGCIKESDLLTYLTEKPIGLEVILTGRTPSEAFYELADYISEIKAIKHPYTKGVKARVGIEK